MKKILVSLIGCFMAICAHAAQIVNVDYVHKLIAQKWDISVPIKADNPMQVANMKYLLTAIDVANEILNGEPTTNYGNGEFATLQVADTTATIQAVDTLIEKKEKYKFSLTINQTHYQSVKKTTDFKFSIGAAGTFYVDWGDGTEETIVKNNTNFVTYSHDYKTTDAVYTIRLGGKATEYSEYITSISFSNLFQDDVEDEDDCSYAHAIESIDGSLGKIFGTLSNNTVKQPTFLYTFWGGALDGYARGCYAKITSIPDDLFAGISGAPTDSMFSGTFSDCRNLTTIPNGLFAGISGAPAYGMFSGTFSYCKNLTTIPNGLFAGISGAPASDMFYRTFYDCSGLTGAIPDGLFAGISGAPASSMFSETFCGCSGLTGAIPAGLFGNLTGAPASYMFYNTFNDCRRLTGAIPDGLFGNLSGAPASFMFDHTFSGCSGLTSIPDGLFAGISGAPARYMFNFTFSSCKGLTSIPDGLFAGISGAPASSMFNYTFYGCSGLTSIPENLFGNISGTAQSYMFKETFKNCTSLTGPSARINGQYLYEIWPSATTSQVNDMYYNATKLSDYSSIPSAWK